MDESADDGSTGLSFAACLRCFLSVPTDASGQAVSATLFGAVTDASVEDCQAQFRVLNSRRGSPRSAQTSDGSEYTIPVLPAGDYAVTVVFSGLEAAKNITLQVAAVRARDFTMSPGEV